MSLMSEFFNGDRLKFADEVCTFKEYYGDKSAVVVFDDGGEEAIVGRHALKFIGEYLGWSEVLLLMDEFNISGSKPSYKSWQLMSADTKNLFVEDIYGLVDVRNNAKS